MKHLIIIQLYVKFSTVHMQALNWSLLTSITDDKVVYRVDCITFYVSASENVQWMRNGQMIPTGYSETVTHELINETNLA